MTLLLISSDAIDVQMAGPGIRYWEFAKQLSLSHDVILLTPNRSSLSHPRIQIRQHTKHVFTAAVRRADVVVTQGYLSPLAPLILHDKPLVVDLYDPMPIELLAQHTHLPLAAAQLSHAYCVARTTCLLQRGDFFLYSHERQRDYWLGMLTAVGRIHHPLYRDNPSGSTLLGCVPYGMSDEPPVHTRTVLRTTTFNITEEDTILLWGGGMWKWFDPCSVIQAMAEIAKTRQDVKLVFLGAKRPAPDATDLNVAYATADALALSQTLGVYNRVVFFHSDWVPYAERQNYLLEADLGISTHFDSLETNFAFRTRLLDYLWAELPIITTRGDVLSNLVEREQLGIVVAPRAVDQIREAILRLTDDLSLRRRCQENIRQIRPQFLWSHSMAPLEAFCAHPYRTSESSHIRQRRQLLAFYANTGKLLIKYRGYQKLFAKLKRKIRALRG